MKKTGDPDIKKAYRKHKYHLHKLTTQAYWRYIEGIITPDDLDCPYTRMRKLWTYINHRRKDNSGAPSPSLKLNGKLYCDPTTKSNILNQPFKSAFSQRTTFTSNEFADSHRMPDADYPIMPDFKFTSNGIEKLLKCLNAYKTPRPDNLSPRLLKERSSEIAPLLQLVYQKSLEISCVPDDWRKANVTPIYKKGPKYLAENYRPVSLTLVCCKIMEHVLASNIKRHGEDNGILYQLQHGFRRNRSCETQLIEFIDDLIKNLQEGLQTDVLIMDFAKAFDKVNHSLLVHKIHQYGIRGKVNSWIKSWLFGRNQTVVVEGVNLSQVDVDFGKPQGSVFGPSLFIYYINDLKDRLRSTVRIFADDTIAYLTIISEDDAQHHQEDLDKLAKWGEDWFMQFHPAKCTVLIVTNKRNPIVTEYTI
jgi:hypothetical protein